MTAPASSSPLDELALRILTMARITAASGVSAIVLLAVMVPGFVLALPTWVVMPVALLGCFVTVSAILRMKTKPMRLRGLRLLRDDPGKIAFIIAVGRAPRARGGAWYLVLTDDNGRLLAPGLRLRDAKVVDEALGFACQLAPRARTGRIQDDTGIRPIEGMAGEVVESFPD